MKITITNESGDFKKMLYTKDKVTYEVKNQEILDFFSKLGEAYNNDDKIDEMYECLYNLINYGYLYTDVEYDNDCYYNYDKNEDYDENYDLLDDIYDFEADEDLNFNLQDGFQLIDSQIEYYVDGIRVTKEDYNIAWDDRIGYLGSSNWEEKGLCITNAETDEVIFLGKMS